MSVQPNQTGIVYGDSLQRKGWMLEGLIQEASTSVFDGLKGRTKDSIIFITTDASKGAGHDVVLDLVGWASEGDSVMKDVFALAKKLDINDKIQAHGYKSVGEELFAYYKSADIYWIASRSSFEGFPRTIWEAMAHSVPVVATSVGSIPDFIEDYALVVKPSKPQELADAVVKLIKTPALRQKFIIAGQKLAKKNTLEFQTKKMVEEIENWLANDKKLA